MKQYNPEVAPIASDWLALDEEERIQLAEVAHHAKREKLPNIRIHAVFHCIVENQIAEGLDAVVRAVPRLMKQGLSRHDTVHALASVYAEQYYEVMKTEDKALAAGMVERYCAGVERLTASAWLRKHE